MAVSLAELEVDSKILIAEEITSAILKKYRTLPKDGQSFMVEDVLTDRFMDTIRNKVKDFYRNTIERDIELDITKEDFVNIYYHKA